MFFAQLLSIDSKFQIEQFFIIMASRGVQGRPGTNRLEWLENEFAALFVGGVNILRIFF